MEVSLYISCVTMYKRCVCVRTVIYIIQNVRHRKTKKARKSAYQIFNTYEKSKNIVFVHKKKKKNSFQPPNSQRLCYEHFSSNIYYTERSRFAQPFDLRNNLYNQFVTYIEIALHMQTL